MILEVQNLDQFIAMAAMMSGLLKNDLKKSLIKIYFWDLPDMLAHVEKYARMEEIFADDTPVSSAMAEPNRERHPRREEKRHHRSWSLPLR